MAYRQEEVKPYGRQGDKGELVEEMFDNIAPTYDTLNHRLSWNIDRGWRRKAIKQLQPFQPQSVLDIATGTGDFALLAAKMLKPKSLIATDISEGMMDVGRKKASEAGLAQMVKFQREDCMQLSFADGTFDAVTSAFGIRNFKDLDQGLREMYRVLKPGGHASLVELTTPVSFPMKQLFRIYSHTVLPLIGNIVSHDKGAYKYLTSSIEAFPQGERMMDALKAAGFAKARFKRLTFGICTMYLAEK